MTNTIMNRYPLIFCLLLTLTTCSSSPKEENNRQPNVLFIISDDLNDAVEGFGGHPQASTPNIDQFAQRSVRFVNAHSNNPICSPSRASLFTGLYPHTSGYYGYAQGKNKWYDNSVLEQATTVFEQVTNQGYNVFATGKLFHHIRPRIFKGEDGSDGYSHLPRDLGPWAYNGKERVGHPSVDPAFGSQGKWPEYINFAPLSDVPVIPSDEEKGILGYKGWVDIHGNPFHYENANNRDLMSDEKHANWAVSQLQKEHEKPFFMAVGFHRPHSPWYAPKKFFEKYPLDKLQLPSYKENDLDDVASILLKDSFEPYQMATDRFKRLKEKFSDQELKKIWKQWLQAYLASVSFVDHQMGKVLQALEQSQYADNTIVIVTSDHGFHMGEKDRIWKHSLWEEATRIPLLIRAPGISKNNVVVDHPVSLIDIYPTLVDLCGLPANPHQGTGLSLDGYSLKPFLKNPETNSWKGPEVALSSINGLVDPGLNQPGKIENQHFSVRSTYFRYTLTVNGKEELYNHRIDPNEWDNLAEDPAYAEDKERLKTRLLQLIDQKSLSNK